MIKNRLLITKSGPKMKYSPNDNLKNQSSLPAINSTNIYHIHSCIGHTFDTMKKKTSASYMWVRLKGKAIFSIIYSGWKWPEIKSTTALLPNCLRNALPAMI